MISSQKIFQITSFINYWLEAMDDHSLHSPFIFGFYREIIRTDNHQPIFTGIEKVREGLLRNRNQIELFDLGAGSSVSVGSKRRISSIAKHSLTRPKNSRLYYRIIQSIGAETVLELGTSLGINTMYMAASESVKHIYTVEGCPQTAEIAKSNFTGFSNSGIELITKPINQAFDHIFNRCNVFNFILFDAHHTYEATLNYYQRCKPHINEHSILIFDDIHWSEGMTRAWNEIQKEIEVTLTIDLFDIGIVFFKKDLEKEDYILSW